MAKLKPTLSFRYGLTDGQSDGHSHLYVSHFLLKKTQKAPVFVAFLNNCSENMNYS